MHVKVRPVQILENPGSRVKNVHMLYLSSKFQVSIFIYPKALHIWEKQFSRPHQDPGPNFEKPRDTCQIFLHALPLC